MAPSLREPGAAVRRVPDVALRHHLLAGASCAARSGSALSVAGAAAIVSALAPGEMIYAEIVSAGMTSSP
ncbi:hypothetical protein ACFYST_24255 [Kitasatospora sp. NPDC004614]|uniref:hypothetical protein n=1 Tax=unclassified Kitasatospora TaxID=2633591 RepID=UPI003690CAAB